MSVHAHPPHGLHLVVTLVPKVEKRKRLDVCLMIYVMVVVVCVYVCVCVCGGGGGGGLIMEIAHEIEE